MRVSPKAVHDKTCVPFRQMKKEDYIDLSTSEQRLQTSARWISPVNCTKNFVQNDTAPAGVIINSPGISNIGNASPMSPNPVTDVLSVSTPGASSMVHNPVSMERIFPAGSGTCIEHDNKLMVSDGTASYCNLSVNMLPQPGQLNTTFQFQQGIGGILTGTGNRTMPKVGMPGSVSQIVPNAGLNISHSNQSAAPYREMCYSNVHSMTASQIIGNSINGNLNHHMYCNENGQIVDTMTSNIQQENSLYGFRNEGTNSGMQQIGNHEHLNASQHISQQVPFKQDLNPQCHQHFTPCGGYSMDAADFASNGNFYYSTSLGGLADANSLCVNAAGLHLSNDLGSQQLTLQGQNQIEQSQFQCLDDSQQIKISTNASALPRDQSLQSQQWYQEHQHQHQLQHERQQYQHQQQKFQQQQYQQKQLEFHQHQEREFRQHQEREYWQRQQKFPQHQHEHDQHQQIQKQQYLLSNREGEQQAQSTSKCLRLKQVGIGLLHRQLLESHGERPQQECQHTSQPPSKQVQPPGKFPQVQETRGLQVHHSSISPWQLPQQHTQRLPQLEALSPQQQQQIQPQINPFVHPTELQPKSGPQEPQELHPLKKFQLLYQVPLREWQKQSQEQVQASRIPGQDEMHQHPCPWQKSSGNLIPTIKTQTRYRTATGGCETSGLSGITELEQQQYKKQQELLLFIQHGSKCSDGEGECQTFHCSEAKLLWAHITRCHSHECLYPQCLASRALLSHHQHCHDIHCPVCVHVRQNIARECAHSSISAVMDFANDASKSASANDTVVTDISLPSRSFISVQGEGQSEHPPRKKAKVESASPYQKQVEAQQESVLNPNKMQVTSQMQPHACQQSGQSPGVVKSEALVSSQSNIAPANMDLDVNPWQGISWRPGKSKNDAESRHEEVQSKKLFQAIKTEPTAVVLTKVPVQLEEEVMQVQQTVVQAKQASVRMVPAHENSATAKLGKTKFKGVSLMELFTPEQIKDHITGLRQCIGQNRGKAEKNQTVEHQMNENTCQLCGAQKLTFDPAPVYCTPCGTRIKRYAKYYAADVGNTRHYLCVSCSGETQGDTIRLDGVTHLKSKLEERKNEEETEEGWVQCDKCEAWQHQICALFNARRNESGQVDYVCPNCYLTEIERGKRKPLPQSTVLGAKDLPRTYLSDHIEQRLSRRLKQERQERARALGKGYEEVPAAEALVVRIVSSVDKKVEVKQHFLEFFQDENYPIELPYKSKVLLLFQKIEGVEVCLFGMYTQEFGSDCSYPNQRRVNISYLDSVKYFRPDVKTVTGEALRTFVYHEIMIGYLDYCKKRGFTSCYIWACPPMKGEDYIFYCHPETQKTPKCDKLREWYLAMLRKATKESIVLDVTNLYDNFFTRSSECKARVTATRLPYFDGDYWPGTVEEVIKQLQIKEEDGRKQQKNWKTKNSTIKWNSKAAAGAEFVSNSSKDAQLMKKLGKYAYPMKEDLIMVHMHHACSHCRLFILSGKRWVCNQCKNFQLCDTCCEADKRLDKQNRHPINSLEKHVLYPIEVTNVPVDTKDADEIMESEFFDTRQAFLSLCQGNHYQYDTLRRAKHSSMMILYHLHNPTAPAFVSTCNVCHLDIETGHGWRCETCPDFDICNTCYQNDGFVDHSHKLTPHPSMAEMNAQNQEARQQRVLQLRKMLDLLVHASQCCSPHCQYTNCRRVKGLFRHGVQCKIRASRGCTLCKKMWYLLQLHGRACKASQCRVPHCKDLKEHMRRLQQQMESRRRAAVMEMMRQRAVDVSGNSD